MSPHTITSLLVIIYIINAVNYGVRGLWGNSWYWLAAAQITIAATWGQK